MVALNGDSLFIKADARHLPFEDDSVDLVFGSPPYESQREYAELQFDKSGDEWVAWAVEVYAECLRVCRGLVAWVVEGVTDDFSYSATPFALLVELKRRGFKVRKPCVYRRNGIPGTGGPDYLRNDWEPIICVTKNGKLPWSDNTAMGHAPKPGALRYATNRDKNGQRKNCKPHTKRDGGDTVRIQYYTEPEIANPGNIIECDVGGGRLGWQDAHGNEAPFPQSLAEFFVKSFCPPGGIVLDPFSGSGTTVAAALACGRRGIGVDLRESQCWLGETRIMGLTVNERLGGQQVLF